jgi:N-acetylneuraminic acid mutarotase
VSGRLVLRVVLGLVVLLVLAAVMRVVLGPASLPGPSLRAVLGLTDETVEPVEPCRFSSEIVRTPAGGPGTWERAGSLPVARDELRAVALRDRVLVGTGFRLDEESGLRSVATLWEYDTDAGEIRRATRTPVPLDHALLIQRRGELYVVGGYSNRDASDRMWRWSPATDTWTELASMSEARGALAGAVIGDKLYAVGGSPLSLAGDIEPNAVLEIYDFGADRWVRGPDVPVDREHHGAAAIDGMLYVVGGRGGGDLSLDSLVRFDPATSRWEELPPLPEGSGGLAAVEHEGELVAIGGGDDGDGWVTGATWAFDPETSRWRRLADLNVPRHGHAAVSAEGRLVVFGGSPCVGYGRTDAIESLEAGG